MQIIQFADCFPPLDTILELVVHPAMRCGCVPIAPPSQDDRMNCHTRYTFHHSSKTGDRDLAIQRNFVEPCNVSMLFRATSFCQERLVGEIPLMATSSGGSSCSITGSISWSITSQDKRSQLQTSIRRKGRRIARSGSVDNLAPRPQAGGDSMTTTPSPQVQ